MFQIESMPRGALIQFLRDVVFVGANKQELDVWE